MGFNFNLARIKNWKTVTVDPQTGLIAGKVERLIWLTLTIGLADVTEKNLEEWKWRLAFLKTTTNDQWYERFTTEFLTELIGLTTNANRRTRAQWLKGWLKTQTLDADNEARNWK